MQGCVGFYFLLFDIYTTDILLFCTRVMKRCFLGHFRLKLTPFPYRLWQRFRLTKYVLNWIKSWVTFENYFLTSPIRYHYPSAIYRVGNDLNPPPHHSLNYNNLKKSTLIKSKYDQCPTLLPNFRNLNHYMMPENFHSFVRFWTLKILRKMLFFTSKHENFINFNKNIS